MAPPTSREAVCFLSRKSTKHGGVGKPARSCVSETIVSNRFVWSKKFWAETETPDWDHWPKPKMPFPLLPNGMKFRVKKNGWPKIHQWRLPTVEQIKMSMDVDRSCLARQTRMCVNVAQAADVAQARLARRDLWLHIRQTRLRLVPQRALVTIRRNQAAPRGLPWGPPPYETGSTDQTRVGGWSARTDFLSNGRKIIG